MPQELLVCSGCMCVPCGSCVNGLTLSSPAIGIVESCRCINCSCVVAPSRCLVCCVPARFPCGGLSKTPKDEIDKYEYPPIFCSTSVYCCVYFANVTCCDPADHGKQPLRAPQICSCCPFLTLYAEQHGSYFGLKPYASCTCQPYIFRQFFKMDDRRLRGEVLHHHDQYWGKEASGIIPDDKPYSKWNYHTPKTEKMMRQFYAQPVGEDGYRRVSGLKWRKITGEHPPYGNLVWDHPALSEALESGKLEFMQAEWDALGVPYVTTHNFVAANDREAMNPYYFQPVPPEDSGFQIFGNGVLATS